MSDGEINFNTYGTPLKKESYNSVRSNSPKKKLKRNKNTDTKKTAYDNVKLPILNFSSINNSDSNNSNR